MSAEYFTRKIYGELLDWKKNWAGEYALLIEGARRVGKSTVVKEFAGNEYESCLFIDFGNPRPNTLDYFRKYSSDLDSLFGLLQMEYGVTLRKGKSLVVFDEIQEYPEARQLIKYLVADGRYDYIETGSLISIKKNVEHIQIPSEEMHIDMHPMDFEEFCLACGDSVTADTIRRHYSEMTPLGQDLHAAIAEKFRTYMMVGGMPQAVKEYVRSKDMKRVETVKKNIIQLYRGDMGRIPVGNGTKARAVFDRIPALLSAHRKVFRPGAVKKGSRSSDYYDSVKWLEEARICNTCYNVGDPNVALNLDSDADSFKCYLLDTGLLVSLAFDMDSVTDGELLSAFLHGRLSVNKGMFFENSVAQQLRSAGHGLHFHEFCRKEDPKHAYETDFLLTSGKYIRPIEVKSSISNRHVSLDFFCEKYRGRVTIPTVIHPKDLRVDGDTVYLPIYMAWLL